MPKELVHKYFMFIGEYSHTIDEKNRLSIPAKFRQQLGSGGVITRGLDNCLFIFTKKDFEKLVEKISDLPLGKAEARGFARVMMAGAMEFKLDKLGRILVPDYLKKYSTINKKVVFAGVLNRIELWDNSKWTAYKTKMERTADQLAETMGEIGI